MYVLVLSAKLYMYKRGLLQCGRKNRSKNQAHDKDIKRESMTHQNDARIEVTIYQVDVVVRGPVYAIREVDIPMVLSRIFL